jgi:hypothetical protein
MGSRYTCSGRRQRAIISPSLPQLGLMDDMISASDFAPCRELRDILTPAMAPCKGFSGPCHDHCTWAPERGVIPRGIGGAAGEAADVRLILVTAEPGDAVDGEKYEGDPATWIAANADIFFMAMSDDSLRRDGRLTPFHRNLKKLLDLCLPNMGLPEQLRLTWFTNTVKCAAKESGGSVPRIVEDTCVGSYLKREIAALPNGFVIALGDKAARRMRRHCIRIDAIALHPSARDSAEAKKTSWERAAEAFRRAKSSPTVLPAAVGGYTGPVATAYTPPGVLYSRTAVITSVQPNPKKPGSSAWVRYNLYRPGLTVAAALQAGLRSEDIRWDLRHGFITLDSATAPAAATPTPATATPAKGGTA